MNDNRNNDYDDFDYDDYREIIKKIDWIQTILGIAIVGLIVIGLLAAEGIL
jgi:hypothetical protein